MRLWCSIGVIPVMRERMLTMMSREPEFWSLDLGVERARGRLGMVCGEVAELSNVKLLM